MAYLSEPLLTSAWDDLNQRVGRINIPIALFRSPQNPAKAFVEAYTKWDERLNAKFSEQGKVVRPFTVAELEQWTASLLQQQTLVGTLEAAYPQLSPSAPTRKVEIKEPVKIEGELPWWYWPLRIGAGVGAGYFIFRVLRPNTASNLQPAFAGLTGAIAKTNKEGLTWKEWLDAAALTVKEDPGQLGRNRYSTKFYSNQIRQAWKSGEDPTEWRNK